MKEAQVLQTLGDYRRAARERLGPLPPSSDSSTSIYDALNLGICRSLIEQLREGVVGPAVTDCFLHPDKACKAWNPPLFRAIQLMEFANAHRRIGSVDELFPGWTQRPDVNAKLFTWAGVSYLEVGFNFVRELGEAIAGCLQDAYLPHKKPNRRGPKIDFRGSDPQTDILEIYPRQDAVIKT